MKKITVQLFVILFVAFGSAVYTKDTGKSGEELFKQHCASCHPDGGNVVNPQKTLHKKDMKPNGIKKVPDVIKTMRNPGKGMTKFDKKTVPDKDAKKIAEYVLKTFD